jgi:protein-tyrosine phosphatase
MRQIPGYNLWLGNARDRRDIRSVLDAGIQAVVDLAIEELPVAVTRELIYCRFPLLDGAGNPPWLLRAAVETVVAFLRAGVPTLVCCGAGMSRSPAVAAAALARVRGLSLELALGEIISVTGPADMSLGLIAELKRNLVVT